MFALTALFYTLIIAESILALVCLAIPLIIKSPLTFLRMPRVFGLFYIIEIINSIQAIVVEICGVWPLNFFKIEYWVIQVFILLMIVLTLGKIYASTKCFLAIKSKYSLDSLPGRQMNIDYDYSSGIISAKTAQIKKENANQISEFYQTLSKIYNKSIWCLEANFITGIFIFVHEAVFSNEHMLGKPLEPRALIFLAVTVIPYWIMSWACVNLCQK